MIKKRTRTVYVDSTQGYFIRKYNNDGSRSHKIYRHRTS